MSETQITPEVLWAQRSNVSVADKNLILLTISVPDVPKDKMKLDLKSTGLVFTGYSDTLKKTYHLDIEFNAEIIPEDSQVNHTGKNVEMRLRKKELKQEFWPRLLKDSKKVHYLKTDFDKWVDEDEQEEAPEEDSMANMGGMNGMPGMGGPGGMDMASMMGGMGGGGDFGGIDFSKLGGGGEGGGLGEMDDDEDDDEMPDLEGEGESTEKSETETETTKPKIEEVN